MVKKKSKYLKDLVNNNSLVSKPDTIWEIDLIYYPKKIPNFNEKQQVYLIIVDNFSRKCLLNFNVTFNQTADNIILIVQEFLQNNNRFPKILHSDYGVQFNSKKWYDYSKKLLELYDIYCSVAPKKKYNLFALNYFVNMCRKNFLNKLDIFNIDYNNIDYYVNDAIQNYNNLNLPILQNTPNLVYNNINLLKLKNIIATKNKIPLTIDQEYINIIIQNKNNFSNNFITQLNEKYKDVNLPLTNSAFPFIKNKRNPRQPRDIISYKELIKLVEMDEYYIISWNKIVSLKYYKKLQVRIAMLLLYLTGCRVSEISGINFKELDTILKEAVIRLWINKDKKPRIIYLNNKVLLKKLNNNYILLKEFCVSNNIYIQNDLTIFFKLKSIGKNYIMESTSLKNSLRSLLNKILSFLKQSKYTNKTWSTHSFRYSIITKLIEKQGIEKTSEFIGHKHINTTQIYYKKKENLDILKNSSKLI